MIVLNLLHDDYHVAKTFLVTNSMFHHSVAFDHKEKHIAIDGHTHIADLDDLHEYVYNMKGGSNESF